MNGELTIREREIAELLAKDYSNKEISELLRISRKTVDKHRMHINKKIGGTIVAIVLWAVRQGLVTP